MNLAAFRWQAKWSPFALIPAANLFLSAPAIAIPQSQPPQITASHGSVAVGRDQNAPITIIGLSPQQARGLIAASNDGWRNLTSKQRHEVDQLTRSLGITTGALQTFFAMLGEQNVPMDQVPQKLGAIAREYLRLQERVSLASGGSPEVINLKREAEAAINRGKFPEAKIILSRIEEIQAEEMGVGLAGLAETAAQRGDLAMLTQEYTEAFDNFSSAIRYEPDDRKRFIDIIKKNMALFREMKRKDLSLFGRLVAAIESDEGDPMVRGNPEMVRYLSYVAGNAYIYRYKISRDGAFLEKAREIFLGSPASRDNEAGYRNFLGYPDHEILLDLDVDYLINSVFVSVEYGDNDEINDRVSEYLMSMDDPRMAHPFKYDYMLVNLGRAIYSGNYKDMPSSVILKLASRYAGYNRQYVDKAACLLVYSGNDLVNTSYISDGYDNEVVAASGRHLEFMSRRDKFKSSPEAMELALAIYPHLKFMINGLMSIRNAHEIVVGPNIKRLPEYGRYLEAAETIIHK